MGNSSKYYIYFCKTILSSLKKMTHSKKFAKSYKDIRRQLGKAVAIVGISLGMAGGFTDCFAQQQKENSNTKVTDTITRPDVVIVEEMPEPIGGFEALYQFLVSEIKYPEMGERHVHGTVLVEFIIEKDGSISNVKIIKSICPQFDQEAIRVIKMMPEWKPGKTKGEAVRCSYQIPIRFSLGDK
jgi:protein TonB